MIITKITSGLGNQLFQYAVAKSLSLKCNTTLFFDLSYYKTSYKTDSVRNFKLHHFNIDHKILNDSPLVYFSKATKLFPGRTFKPLFLLLKEKHFHFDAAVLQAKAACITLDGFWQSEKYFINATEVIRKELIFTTPKNARLDHYKSEINNSQNAVSIHIRRGDYVSHPEFSKSFGFIGLEYYVEAINYIKSKIDNPTFFVFSDDKEWVIKNFPLSDDYIFVENTGDECDVKDLQLMSLCKHHVIANSSFSWWGAWLNDKDDKIVVSPKSWYKNKPDWNTKDLLPASWITF
jgi:hypothetical protein